MRQRRSSCSSPPDQPHAYRQDEPPHDHPPNPRRTRTQPGRALKQLIQPVAKSFHRRVAHRGVLETAKFAPRQHLPHGVAFRRVSSGCHRRFARRIRPGQVASQAHFGVPEQFRSGARRRLGTFLAPCAFAAAGFRSGLRLVLLPGFGEKGSQPPVAHQPTLRIGRLSQRNPFVRPNQSRIASFCIPHLGASLHQCGQCGQVLAVIFEGRIPRFAGSRWRSSQNRPSRTRLARRHHCGKSSPCEHSAKNHAKRSDGAAVPLPLSKANGASIRAASITHRMAHPTCRMR